MARQHPDRRTSTAGTVGARVRPLSHRAWWSHWPRYSGYAAAGWSFVYGAFGLCWAAGGAGFPYGESDPESDDVLSVLSAAQAESTGSVIAVLGVVGTVVGLVMTTRFGRGVLRRLLLAFGWACALGLCLVVPDYRLLALLTRIPFIMASPLFGMPGRHEVVESVPWPRLNLLLVVAGGLLWALATVAYQRRTSGLCETCGRGDSAEARWTSPDGALRWGRWATWVAVAVPTLYAVTRIAWWLGIPLGIPRDFYAENRDTGILFGGLLIALTAIGWAVLTLGLVQRWGEVFPRWAWLLAGRRVPPPLAIIPAAVVAVLVIPAGVMAIRLDVIRGVDPEAWAMTWPAWLWPLWGLALGAATYAYHLRRRTSVCEHCGKGREPGRPPAVRG